MQVLRFYSDHVLGIVADDILGWKMCLSRGEERYTEF